MIDCYTTDPDLLHEALNAQDVEIESLKQQLAAKDALLNTAREIISRYRFEIPPGRQPHMICLEAEDCIAAIDKDLWKP